MERLSGRLTEAHRQAESALSMTDDRNLVVHVYREAVASDLDSRLHLHAVTLAAWLGAIAALTAVTADDAGQIHCRHGRGPSCHVGRLANGEHDRPMRRRQS